MAKHLRLLGPIAGDIIGSIYEFSNIHTRDFPLFGKGCSFTDDSVCTIGIADALLTGRSFGDSLRSWCLRYPHPMGGYGGRFRGWVFSRGSGPYNSCGNGSAMRVAACGWYSEDSGKCLQAAELSASCTHNHPEGVKGAVCTTAFIFAARHGETKDGLRKLAHDYYPDYDFAASEPAPFEGFNALCQNTVPQAIHAVLSSTGFEDCMRLVMSLGGDSDTNGAIAGAMAEALYGGISPIEEETVLGYLPDDIKEVITAFNEKFIKE